MALLATQSMVAGTAQNPTFTAAAASDTVTSDTGLFLWVKNGGGSSDTVTVVVPGAGLGAVAVPDIPHTVPNGTDRLIYIPPQAVDPTTGLITVTHSFTTSVTQALIRVGV